MKNDNQIFELAAKEFSKEILEEEKVLLKKLLNESAENRNIYNDLKIIFSNTESAIPDFSDKTEAALNKVTEKITQSKPKFHITPLAYKIAAVLVVGLFISIFSFVYLSNNHATTVISTNDEIKKIELADGTVIWLNKNTTISYNSDFNEEDRLIDFEGEAYFIVAHNKSKPFIVKSFNSETRVLGTQFNLKTNKTEIKLNLTKGKVEFTNVNTGNSSLLVENELVTMNRNTGLFTKDNTYNVNYMSWKTGELSFSNIRLENVASDLSKHYGVEIKVLATIKDRKFNTTKEFKNVEINEILKLLEITMQLNIDTVNNVIIIKSNNAKN